jgi:hypothetical protein
MGRDVGELGVQLHDGFALDLWDGGNAEQKWI